MPHASRRRFLRVSAFATGSALVTAHLFRHGRASGKTAPRVAIVGGGLAGLNAAYQLKKAGTIATVYEARERVGGRVLSSTARFAKGAVVELGGSFINSDHEDMLALVKEFGLELVDRSKFSLSPDIPEEAFFVKGEFRPTAEVAEKLRPLAEQIAADARLLEEDFERYAPGFDRLSAAGYLNLHAGKIPEPYIRVLVENTIRTEFGVEPEKSSALQLLYNLPSVEGDRVELLGASDERYVIKGGNSRLVEKLAAALPGQIRTGARLTAIESKGMGFRLAFAGIRPVEAEWVILALPFTVLREVRTRVALPAGMKRFIEKVSLGSNEKLIAGFNSSVWRKPSGFARGVWTDLGFSEAWDETLSPSSGKNNALTFFFGGAEVSRALSGSPTERGKEIVKRFDKVIPGATRAANARFSRTAWTEDPFTRGAYTNFEPGQLTEFGEFLYVESDDPGERRDVRFGNLVFAGEQVSDEFFGYMNGAAQTGRLAAGIILRALHGSRQGSP